MIRQTFALCALAVLAGCSSGAHDAGKTGGWGGHTGATGATVGSGGAGGTGSSGNGVFFDGGLSDADASTTIPPDAACATSTTQAGLRPVDMYILFDRSASMTYKSKWNLATAALTAFFQDPASAGLNVALRFFPGNGCDKDTCDPAACSAPLVPLGQLTSSPAPADAQEQALVSASSGATPSLHETTGGGTPLSAALAGAEDWATATLTARPSDKVAVILVSDGEPNGCDMSYAHIDAIAAAAQAKGVSTYAVGIAGYFQTEMDAIAQAGGTSKAFFIGNTNVGQDLIDALKTIQATQVSCSLPMPQGTASDPVDITRVNVNYTPGGGSLEALGQTANAAACSASGGWYYDDPMAPTMIMLCPSTCGVVQADTGAKIDIVLGCKTTIALK